MLFDIERTIKKMDKNIKSDEYKDLVYDLESFIIDYSYDNGDALSSNDAERQSYLGKIELVNKVLDERESEKVFIKIRPVLLQLGINEGVTGFRLLEGCVLEAARMIVTFGTYKMKDIYPIVAKNNSITAHNCERLCRYACGNIVPGKEFARKYPFFEALTHRTYEAVTVKELVDVISEAEPFRNR